MGRLTSHEMALRAFVMKADEKHFKINCHKASTTDSHITKTQGIACFDP